MERLNNNTRMEFKGNSEALKIDDIVSRAMADFNKDQSQDIVHETPTSKQNGKKIFGALATAAAISLGMTGCAEVQETPIPVTDVQPSETTKLSTSEVIVTPEDTSGTKSTTTPEATDPKVTVKPATTVGTSAETQYVTQAPTETTIPTTVETTTNAELDAAPEISGLSKEIQDGKVVYKAVEGNEYGLEVGEISGTLISKDIIAVESNPTGGVVLDSRVAKVLLNNESNKTILPLNVNNLTKEDGFNIDYAQLTSYGINKNAIIVNFKNPVELINSSKYGTLFAKSNDLMSLSFTKNENNFEIKDLLSIACVPIQNPETNEFIFDGDTSKFNLDKEYLFGESFGLTAKSCLIVDMASGPNVVDLDTSNLLKTSDGRIIFIELEEKVETN